jgi:hypothetical protein
VTEDCRWCLQAERDRQVLEAGRDSSLANLEIKPYRSAHNGVKSRKVKVGMTVELGAWCVQLTELASSVRWGRGCGIANYAELTAIPCHRETRVVMTPKRGSNTRMRLNGQMIAAPSGFTASRDFAWAWGSDPTRQMAVNPVARTPPGGPGRAHVCRLPPLDVCKVLASAQRFAAQ